MVKENNEKWNVKKKYELNNIYHIKNVICHFNSVI